MMDYKKFDDISERMFGSQLTDNQLQNITTKLLGMYDKGNAGVTGTILSDYLKYIHSLLEESDPHFAGLNDNDIEIVLQELKEQQKQEEYRRHTRSRHVKAIGGLATTVIAAIASAGIFFGAYNTTNKAITSHQISMHRQKLENERVVLEQQYQNMIVELQKKYNPELGDLLTTQPCSIPYSVRKNIINNNLPNYTPTSIDRLVMGDYKIREGEGVINITTIYDQEVTQGIKRSRVVAVDYPTDDGNDLLYVVRIDPNNNNVSGIFWRENERYSNDVRGYIEFGSEEDENLVTIVDYGYSKRCDVQQFKVSGPKINKSFEGEQGRDTPLYEHGLAIFEQFQQLYSLGTNTKNVSSR